ncbi:MAG TPA: M20/M25/M40 family metallo-hydrolase [Gemmatimonadaceae bacterium]
MKSRTPLLVALAVAALSGPLQSQSLSRTEQRIRDYVYGSQAEAIALLEQSVNINSGTMTHAGVRAVGDVYAKELAAIGFETRWVEMPPEVNRAGHLVAERRPRSGNPRGKRLLLIGHLDTVFEGEGTTFQRVDDSTAKGAGTNDMKGGDVVAIQALKALNSVGALNNMHVIVVFTGDEESAGDPLEIARRDLLEAARRTDVALGFESGEPSFAVVARRSSSDWLLEVTGRQAHSSGIFGEATGYGAIFETARIIDAFREALAGQENLTFGPGIIVGGTDVTYDTVNTRGTAAGKTNIVPRAVTVHGDLRALTQGQQDSARAAMRGIVESGNLPHTSARIRFGDSYPPMSPRPENYELLAQYDRISRALGFGAVEAHDPKRRGAADISFVAPIIPGLDGLGPWGRGGHTPDEDVNLNSMPIATARAAILMYRLGRER